MDSKYVKVLSRQSGRSADYSITMMSYSAVSRLNPISLIQLAQLKYMGARQLAVFSLLSVRQMIRTVYKYIRKKKNYRLY